MRTATLERSANVPRSVESFQAFLSAEKAEKNSRFLLNFDFEAQVHMCANTHMHLHTQIQRTNAGENDDNNDKSYLIATEIWWKYSIIFGASAFTDSLIKPKKNCSASSSLSSNLWI